MTHRRLTGLLTAITLLTGSGVATEAADQMRYDQINRQFSVSQKANYDKWLKRLEKTPVTDAKLRADLEKNREQLSPFFLFHLAERTFAQDPEAAVKWYWMGQVRARMDALLCSDTTARQGTSYLAAIAPSVAEYIGQHNRQAGEIGLRVLEQPDLASSTVSPWWICSHGIQAFLPHDDKGPRPWWITSEEQAAKDYAGMFEGARAAFDKMAATPEE